MRVLITGANGFVGTNVSRYLTAQGLVCLALDIAGAPEQGVYAVRYTWDELDAIPWREVAVVIHLAGKAHDTKNTSEAQSYFDINVGLTKKILEKFANAGMRECGNAGETPRHGEADPSQCANAGIRKCGNEREGISDQSTHELAHSRIRALKFIFFSSVKACADTVEGVLTEEQVPMPKTPYGMSKLEAEGEVLKCVSSKVLNFRPYILRPAMIHGPGNKGNLNLLVKVVQKGIPWPLGAFENQRSFTSIDNVSRVLEALITTDVAPGTYQVADDEPLSTNQVIGLIAASLGRRPKLWRIPRSFMKGVARLGDILHLPLNSERLKKLTESYVVSNRKLLRALGWQKMPVSAEEGMRATFIVTTQWSQ